jgi:hypothetical protein
MIRACTRGSEFTEIYRNSTWLRIPDFDFFLTSHGSDGGPTAQAQRPEQAKQKEPRSYQDGSYWSATPPLKFPSAHLSICDQPNPGLITKQRARAPLTTKPLPGPCEQSTPASREAAAIARNTEAQNELSEVIEKMEGIPPITRV